MLAESMSCTASLQLAQAAALGPRPPRISRSAVQRCRCRAAAHSGSSEAAEQPASRRAALALLGAVPLAATAAAAAAAAEPDAAAASAAVASPAEADTTPTHRMFLDVGLCAQAVKVDRGLGAKTPFCTDPAPLGRIVIDLYGRAAPGSVANIVAALQAGAYADTALSKVLPGRYIILGAQGPKRSGLVQAPEGLAPNPDLLSSAAFRLRHLRPGTVSLNLSDSQDEQYIRGGQGYRPLSLLVTTGPAPVPSLDGENIVVGQVVEGLDVIQAITQVPTFNPNSTLLAYNKFASAIGDDRAAKTAAKWGRPLQAILVTGAGLL